MKHAHTFTLITPEQLHQKMQDTEPPVLVDTLPAGRFAKVHLPGAQNACVYEITFIDQLSAICAVTDTPLVLYGADSSSLDSRTAAEKLAMAGYSNISVLDGGLERWRQAGYPLAGETPESGDRDDELLLDDGEYRILRDQSTIYWTGRNANSSHYGTVNLASGRLQVAGTSLQGSFMVDMESIANINLAGSELQQVLVNHLKSEDFFLTDGFPAARFNIRGGRFNPESEPTSPNCEITGTLELRGVQNDLAFKATLVKWIDGHLHLTANFELDRTLWSITYGSSRYYRHLGMHTVFDLISIELRIVASREG